MGTAHHPGIVQTHEGPFVVGTVIVVIDLMLPEVLFRRPGLVKNLAFPLELGSRHSCAGRGEAIWKGRLCCGRYHSE